jgi:hypothetical protein
VVNTHKIVIRNLKGRGHLGDIGVDERIMLKWILNKEVCDVDWIHLAQDRD